jgi:peptidoglycan/LPS O-acetylase OafA/YrhL
VAARRPAELAREPLAWTAVLAATVTALFAVALVVVGWDEESGLALDLALRSWPLVAGVVLWRSARRVHDPVEE